MRSSLLDLLIIYHYCGSPLYFKNVGLALAHFDYLERINHPVYHLLVSDVSAFVEEPGEISFGILGGLEARVGKQPDNYAVVRQHFRLLHVQIETHNLISGVTDAKPSKITEYDDTSKETVLLHSWMIALIDDCMDGSYRPYAQDVYKTSNVPQYKDTVMEDEDFTLDGFPVIDDPRTIFDLVEPMITRMHRLWQAKRRARIDSDV